MKKLLLAILLLPLISFSQNEKTTEKKLLSVFKKIKDYREGHELSTIDTAKLYNKKFKTLLIKTLQNKPETINYEFKGLQKEYLDVTTSADKKFRIYSWDDMQGGTMRYINNVYQTQLGKKQVIISKDNDGYINSIDILKTTNATYYLVSRMFKGSSALFLQTIDIYKIDAEGNLIAAPIIKTKSRITNTISCEADYSRRVNHSTDFIETYITYVADKKEIHVPLIQADGKITKSKIVYRFSGSYFEKVKDLYL